ncbi:hypothetical protein TCON_2395 [Astathelohania contejeani]|uniref:Uncharacterized protein n=1 Tax=Astathelohania contejeani TaxID=164912 RepID=A0ABQ7HW53_9MICR|nr:hypothetical protein TCON_2395 [Thelohania contejeani]
MIIKTLTGERFEIPNMSIEKAKEEICKLKGYSKNNLYLYNTGEYFLLGTFNNNYDSDGPTNDLGIPINLVDEYKTKYGESFLNILLPSYKAKVNTTNLTKAKGNYKSYIQYKEMINNLKSKIDSAKFEVNNESYNKEIFKNIGEYIKDLLNDILKE